MRYARKESSFGQLIARRRKELGISQKDLAARILKDDGAPYSAQSINDMENDRRLGGSEHVIFQLAEILKFPADALFLAARSLPPDIDVLDMDLQKVSRAFSLFKEELKGSGGG